MKTSYTATIQLDFDTTIQDLSGLFYGLPENTKVRVIHHTGDTREPGYSEMVLSWTRDE